MTHEKSNEKRVVLHIDPAETKAYKTLTNLRDVLSEASGALRAICEEELRKVEMLRDQLAEQAELVKKYKENSDVNNS